jgi:hypothetical protein
MISGVVASEANNGSAWPAKVQMLPLRTRVVIPAVDGA